MSDRKLYRITAHHKGGRTQVSYVVAHSTTDAEKLVEEMHDKAEWWTPDYFSSETFAEENRYGTPFPLIVQKAIE